jgi:uncharacterized membrane protein
MWIKNTDGKPDAMLTFATIAFVVVIFNIFLATFGTMTIFGFTISFVAMEAGTMTAFLAPTLMAYVSRRWTSRAYPLETSFSDGGIEYSETFENAKDKPVAKPKEANITNFHPSGEGA